MPVFSHVLLALVWDVVLILQLSLTRAAWGDAHARSHCISFSWWRAGLLWSHTSLSPHTSPLRGPRAGGLSAVPAAGAGVCPAHTSGRGGSCAACPVLSLPAWVTFPRAAFPAGAEQLSPATSGGCPGLTPGDLRRCLRGAPGSPG